MALIDKASLLMVPSTYEAGTLYNVLPSGNRAPDSTDQNSGYDQTRADFTFDRGSNAAATRVNADGLIEKYRENLLTFSNDFSNAAWGKTNISVTSGQADKDGGTNAWKISETTANSVHILLQTTSSVGMYTFSVYLKGGTKNKAMIFDGTNNLGVKFNLETRAFNSFYGASMIYNIEELDNGWARYSITSPSASTAFRVYLLDDSYNLLYTGDTTNNIYIQSAQVETGLVATDYLDSGATTAKAGVLIDLPRINYDANGENGALLLEPQRANKFSFSEYFGASDWLKSGNGSGSAPVITDNYAISPEGVKNAARVQFDAVGTAATDRSTLAQRFAFTTGDVYTISCWVKATTGNSTMFHFRANGAQVGGEQIATDEWKLFKATHTATATTTDDYGMQIRGTYSSNTSDILIYGMQLENASYNTSYIPNHGTSGGVTRAADSCSVTGVSDVIGQTEGTFFVEFEGLGSNTAPYLALSASGSTANRVLIYESSGINAQIKVGGSIVFQSTTASVSGNVKAAVSYKANDFVLYVNGSQYGTSSSGSTFTGSTLNEVEFDHASAALIGAKMKQAVLFKERLSNAELATLTTL